MGTSPPLKDHPPAHHRLQHLNVADLVNRASEDVLVEHCQVGELAGFQGADLVFEEQDIRLSLSVSILSLSRHLAKSVSVMAEPTSIN